MSADFKHDSDFPNISIDMFRGGGNSFQLPSKMIRNCICSVLRAFVNLENMSQIQAARPQIQIDAERLGLSLSDYVVKLAFFHENNQEHPSSDINVIIVRFITHLMKIRGDHSDLIHDLQEVRENLNRASKNEVRSVQNDFENHIIQARLKSIFH